ncbi:MAG: undecaprenyl-diphosphate phosphatase [Candidatus Omnitrophota bacterium]
MTLIEALIAGVVQGLTEFLPVSSSGHLVLVHKFFGFTEPSIFFDICLHAATLMAVILYFGRDIVSLIREKNFKWFFYIAIATVPAVLAALLFEDRISTFFTSPVKVAFMLVITGTVLLIGQVALWKRDGSGKKLSFFTALAVGIAQAFALLPGISRSGMTISTGLAGGMKAEEAFKFSFLLSIPVILGAALYKALTVDLGAVMAGNTVNYLAGMMTAFVVGLLSLHVLWKIVKGKMLYIFAAYCLLLGAIGIFFWK